MGKLERRELERLMEGDCVGKDKEYWRLVVPTYTLYPMTSGSRFAFQLSAYVACALTDEIPPKTKPIIKIAKVHARSILILTIGFSSQHASFAE